MNDIFRVAIHFNNDYGYIEYDAANKKVNVVLPNPAKKEQVEQYLNTAQVIRSAQHTLRDFTQRQFVPSESLDQLKLALTRMWESTQVLVDWSRPVRI